MTMKTQAQQTAILDGREKAAISDKMLLDAIEGYDNNGLFVAGLKKAVDKMDKKGGSFRLTDDDCVALEQYFGRRPSERLRMGWVG